MSDSREGMRRAGVVTVLAALTLGVGLGASGRLTYHEAFVAQAAREMIATGDVVIPTIGGRPWLEKPPLAIWLVALAGRAVGGVSEAVARAPAALAATLLAWAVATLAARRFGTAAGLLAGLIQVTTVWTVMRGRLAEVDVILAGLVAWAVVAFDHLRSTGEEQEEESAKQRWRWAFFALLGLTALAKGVGFGAVLVLAVAAVVMAWDRDFAACRRLRWVRGWMLTAIIGLIWPLLATLRHPSAIGLWFLHVSDRLAAEPRVFTGQSWWRYCVTLAMMLIPWLPLMPGGAGRSLRSACMRGGRFGGDRLLWAWTVAPLALLSLATVKNAHYAIHALPPCSVWAALGLLRLGARWQTARGWRACHIRRVAWVGFIGLGLAYAGGFAWLGPRLDRRGVEWAFYERAARRLAPGEPVALLYHVPEWDRAPYESPFGPFPHDWAVRLYYLNHPAPCRFGLDELAASPIATGSSPFAVIGRESDRDGLSRLGRVETLAEGPPVRFDRTYRLFRVSPASRTIAAAPATAPRR